MAKINISANKELFEKWKGLGLKISLLSGIVQNDMEITEEEFIEWRNLYYKLQDELNVVMATTVMTILGENKGK